MEQNAEMRKKANFNVQSKYFGSFPSREVKGSCEVN